MVPEFTQNSVNRNFSMFPSSTGKPREVAIGILDRTLTTNQGTEDLEYKPNVGELSENYFPVYSMSIMLK